jgi:hypothetical protein
MGFLLDRLVAKNIADTGTCGDVIVSDEIRAFYEYMTADDNKASHTMFGTAHGYASMEETMDDTVTAACFTYKGGHKEKVLLTEYERANLNVLTGCRM